MNNESPKNKQRLLDDVLREDSFAEFNGQLKRQALGALQRARLVRRIVGISSVATVAACIAIAGLVAVRSSSSSRLNQSPVLAAARSASPIEISEEQLVKMFPPDSCFVAEVNGKKMLVFRDAKLRAQYLN